jgi:hypothetical protein
MRQSSKRVPDSAEKTYVRTDDRRPCIHRGGGAGLPNRMMLAVLRFSLGHSADWWAQHSVIHRAAQMPRTPRIRVVRWYRCTASQAF